MLGRAFLIAAGSLLIAGSNARAVRELGQGGNKIVRPMRGRPDRVVGIAKPGRVRQIEREKRLLAILARNGVPVVRTFPAPRGRIRYQRMAAGSKDPGFRRYLNQRSLRTLNRIERALIDSGIAVSDLQFLVGPGGRLVVADPYALAWRDSPANARQIRRLRRRIRAQLD